MAEDDIRSDHATIAIMTALPLEFSAMKAMLDDPVDLSTQGRAPGEYVLGTIPSKEGARHVIALALCSVGGNFAAINTAILLERLPRITAVLMVGIAGGIPDPAKPEADVRLGDIVTSNKSGTIQYDHDKELYREGKVILEPRPHPRPPSERLLRASQEVEVLETEGRATWRGHIDRAKKTSRATSRPVHDVLRGADEPHAIVERSPRSDPGRSRTFSGTIASGNKLLRNPHLRERLRQTFDAKAVEMEAAGVADAAHVQRAGHFVVRGISDYCDKFKDDDWQQYAAVVAAAYARGLLEHTRSEPLPAVLSGNLDARQLEDVPGDLDRDVRASLPKTEQRFWLGAAHELLVSARSNNTKKDNDHSSLVLKALMAVRESDLKRPPLSGGDLLLATVFPDFVAFVGKRLIQNEFAREPNDDWYAELDSALPSSGMTSDLSPEARDLLITSAVERVVRRRQATWTDELIRTLSPDARLGRWLAADSHVSALVRAAAGDMTAFANLPEIAAFRFEDHSLDVRWKNLAAMLVLADSRALGPQVVSADALENLIYLPDVAVQVSDQLAAATFDEVPDNRLELRATCDEPVLDYMLTEVARNLNEVLHDRSAMSDHLARQGFAGFPHIETAIKAKLEDGVPRYTTPPVNFSLSARHARRLFMGSDLWGKPEFAYRELYQNALDACRYRVARSRHLGLKYDPVIRIYHGRDANGDEFVECEDNGIGMDRNVIASCFAIAGNRFVQTEEYRKESGGWQFKHKVNSQFGVGVFSYFLVADRLELETARLNVEGEVGTRLHISVPTSSSFFRIVSITLSDARAAARERAKARNGSDPPPLDAGTRVLLRLRRDLAASDLNIEEAVTCVSALRRNIWFSDVRTEVRDYRGDYFVLEPGQLAPWIQGAVAAEGTELSFWWLANSDAGIDRGGKPSWIFRSRTNGADGKAAGFRCDGTILVDGIVTGATAPGFIVNLDGKNLPRLSLDRREVRSDIRELLETTVDQAVSSIPTVVAEHFLIDLWRWNPRACHRATTLNGPTWTRLNWRSQAGAREPLLEKFSRPFLPPLPSDGSTFSTFGAPGKHLFDLWRLANEYPEAHGLSKFIRESRGIGNESGSKLAVVPAALWNALGKFALGVPEAAAIHYGLGGHDPRVVSAYMSWQTGETVGACSERLARLAEFLGREPMVSGGPAVVVTDHDAWLLGHGDPKPPWAGPSIATVDVCRFCAHSGRELGEVVAEYRELTQRLGWELVVDEALATEVGRMSNEEVRFLASLQSGFPELVAATWVTRADLLARLVSRPLPELGPEPDVTALGEEQKAIAQKLSSRPTRGSVRLVDACRVAREMGQPIERALAAVCEVAEKLGAPLQFDESIARKVAEFTDMHWSLVEARGVFGYVTIDEPRDTLDLAKRLAGARYSFRGKDAKGILELLEEVHGLFGWRKPTLTTEQIQAAVALDFDDARVLESIAGPGKLRIAQVLNISLERGKPIPEIAKSIDALSIFGIEKPSVRDTYLGISWQELVAADTSVSDAS